MRGPAYILSEQALVLSSEIHQASRSRLSGINITHILIRYDSYNRSFYGIAFVRIAHKDSYVITLLIWQYDISILHR